MIKYIVTLSESDGETIVGRYDSLEEAQQHLKNGYFTYTIKTEVA